MKRFITKTVLFAGLLILLFGGILFLPSTPRSSKSLLFAEIQKDSLLKNVPSPRIIFVGGSGLLFGLNSQEIKDSLNINPINTANMASIGIKYMLENTMQYVKKGDIIVFIPEYSHFCNNDWNAGSAELLRIILNVNGAKISLLNKEQMLNCLSNSGALVLSKFYPSEYINVPEGGVYTVNSLNKYGDCDAHWNLKNREIKSQTVDNKKYNPKIIEGIKHIANMLQEKGCFFLISYPCLQETAFNNSKEAIKHIDEEYHAHGFTVLGNPERYMVPDSLLFDSPWHLNKQGVDLRTRLLIEDLKTTLKKK